MFVCLFVFLPFFMVGSNVKNVVKTELRIHVESSLIQLFHCLTNRSQVSIVTAFAFVTKYVCFVEKSGDACKMPRRNI